MSLPKASAGGVSVDALLRSVADSRRRQDCYFLVKLMQNVVGEPARVWGDSVLGFAAVLLLCVAASVVAIRMALKVDPAEAIGG